MDDEYGTRCLLSHPAYPPHNLSFRSKNKPSFQCFTCGESYVCSSLDYAEYSCTTCGVEVHHGCHKHPRRITHPYHFQHPLTLFNRNPETGVTSNTILPNSYESFVDTNTSCKENSVFLDIIPPVSDIIFDKCTWCGRDFKGDWFYRCLICGFCLDLLCAQARPPLTIANPKSHHHSLLFLPRPLLVPCDACGLVDAWEASYVCFQCNYMAHQSCLDLPRVIKITRHQHRLSYVPYGSPVVSSCRICYKPVDIKYGQYTCNHEDCSYVAHSKCATHKNVWDGKELEWEAEEDNETDDIAPFKKLEDGLIKHFGHIHPLKLKKHDGVREREKQCQVCIFPMVTHDFYHCEECNYSLHEVCAGLSRKLDHALHNHTLTLNPPPYAIHSTKYRCSACSRSCTGFRYKCSKGCYGVEFNVRCISVPEYFTHKGHEYPLFLPTSHHSNNDIPCKVCKETSWGSHLQCTVCEFTMCYTCATIPDGIHYRFDKHPLTLCCGESVDGMYWCEMCEKQLDPRGWFYTCNECCITIHLECIFGSSVFMKPGSKFTERYGSVTVHRNSSSTRQFCYGCDQRCTGSIYYEGEFRVRIWYNNQYVSTFAFCSLKCVRAKMGRSV